MQQKLRKAFKQQLLYKKIKMEKAGKEKFKVTPWEVSGKVDYNRLIKEFGTERISENMLKGIEKLAGDLHFLLRRKIFFSHRDLNWLFKEYEKGNKFFLYTGRGPSGKTHIGHLVPWILTKWFQDKFNCNLYFQFTDDEKFLFNPELSLKDTKKLAYENALDVIAIGFDAKRTKFIMDTENIKKLYPLALKVAKKLTFSTVKAVFGFTNETNVGSIFFTTIQSAPCFFEDKPCLIPLAIDQDAHFRITRDIAPKLGLRKPALVHSIFLPGLTGSAKMSSSIPGDALFTTDTPKQVEKKVKKYAFSGGQPTVAEHRKKGGNPDIDISYQWLKILFEPDDKKLQKIYNDYKSGKLLTSELKEILIEKVKAFLKKHQVAREKAKKQLDKFILKD